MVGVDFQTIPQCKGIWKSTPICLVRYVLHSCIKSFYIYLWFVKGILRLFKYWGWFFKELLRNKPQVHLRLSWGSVHSSYCTNIQYVGLTSALLSVSRASFLLNNSIQPSVSWYTDDMRLHGKARPKVSLRWQDLRYTEWLKLPALVHPLPLRFHWVVRFEATQCTHAYVVHNA